MQAAPDAARRAGRHPRPMPATHRIVIAGGGIAALEALVALRGRPPAGAGVTLVSPERAFSYRPLGIREPFGGGAGRRFALPAMARDLDAHYVRDAVAHVDAPRRTGTLRSGRELGYDTLIVAIGARSYPAFAHGITFDQPGGRD